MAHYNSQVWPLVEARFEPTVTYHEFVIQLAPDELDALLVRGQSVGVVADGRVHVTETGRDSMNE